jgi:hypothetical protein
MPSKGSKSLHIVVEFGKRFHILARSKLFGGLLSKVRMDLTCANWTIFNAAPIAALGPYTGRLCTPFSANSSESCCSSYWAVLSTSLDEAGKFDLSHYNMGRASSARLSFLMEGSCAPSQPVASGPGTLGTKHDPTFRELKQYNLAWSRTKKNRKRARFDHFACQIIAEPVTMAESPAKTPPAVHVSPPMAAA